MSRRTILTLSTAASLYGLYAVYAFLVSPHIAPPFTELPEQQNLSQDQLLSRSSKSQDEADRWLSQFPWVKKAKYEFRPDKQSYIYTQERDTLPSGEIRLQPFAMISHRADDPPDRQPITIVSESALITFENGAALLKLESGLGDPEVKSNPGRIVGAALQGEVQLRGPDNMSMITRDVAFSESAQRLWNDQPVAFTYRQHHGTAHGLEMDLLSGPQKTASRDKPNISGVRTIRLVRDVVMNLVPEQKSAKGSVGKPGPRTFAQNRDRDGRTVVVTSKGRFEFVVEANVATFQNDVVVRSPTGPDEFDTLRNVDTLTLIFERVASKGKNDQQVAALNTSLSTPHVEPALPAEGNSGRNKRETGELEFRRLKAEGRPALLSSQKSQLNAKMEEVVYDAANRIIALRDPKQVQAVQKNNELFAPEITLPLGEGGKVLSAVCRGRGSVRTYAPELPAGEPASGHREMQFFAEWSQQMRKYPDPDSTLELIELHGDAVLNQPDKMALRADLVKIWITSEDEKPAAPRDSTGKPSRGGAKPRRLLALDKVAFVTPQMRGETKQLRVWFEDGKLSPAPAAPEASASRRPNRAVFLVEDDHDDTLPVYRPTALRGTVSQRPYTDPAETPRATADPVRTKRRTPRNHVPANQPADDATSQHQRGFAAVDDLPLNASPSTPASRRERHRNRDKGSSRRRQESTESSALGQGKQMHIVADVISVRTLQDGSKSEVAEVVTERNVHIKQDRGEGVPPMEVHGERLHLWNHIGNKQIVDVTGLPAEVRDRGLRLEGAKIHLDRGRNLLSVQGAGKLRLPLQSGLDGRKLNQPQFLDVWWEERMDFDGLVANFFERVKSVFGENRVNCQAMKVTLTRHVSFSEPNSQEPGRGAGIEADESTPKADVDTVHCSNGVDIENREYIGNRLTEIRKANTFEMTMSQKTGDISASGPGTLKIWRRRNGSRPGGGLMGPRGAATKRPAEEDTNREPPALPWEYTQVDFAGAMKGNGRERTTTFQERVQVVHGPVESSQKMVDGDDLPREGGWMKCDSLQLTQRPPANPQLHATLEMLANGNAEMEGQNREFHGMADTISYDESKGMFMLRSIGTRKATIWRQTRPGAEPSRAEAQRMEFIPSRNDLKTFGTSGVEGLFGK